MIIALDACDILKERGSSETYMAGSVEGALALIAKNCITLAVLDVNLRSQTRMPITAKRA